MFDWLPSVHGSGMMPGPERSRPVSPAASGEPGVYDIHGNFLTAEEARAQESSDPLFQALREVSQVRAPQIVRRGVGPEQSGRGQLLIELTPRGEITAAYLWSGEDWQGLI